MRLDSFLGASVIAAAAVAGCYTGPTVDAKRSGTATEVAGTEPVGAEPASADLPCDVANVLASACSSCHGATLAEGAPNRLVSYDDLSATLKGNDAVTQAQLSLARMKDALKPMPPSSPASPDAIAIIEKWIADGMPKGSCAATGIDYSVEATCTSKARWTRGDRGSDDMHPGDACIDCHTRERAERFTVAGTIYPTAHEPSDCNGTDGRASKTTVVITDAAGKTFNLAVNSVGNFSSRSSIKAPFRAKVVRGNAVFEMQAEITDGDCNGCHTADGTFDDPAKPRGRIVLP